MVNRITTSRGDDSEFREWLRHLAAERRRFGYRRLHILLRREGVEVNHKKLFRIYREERLAVRRRGGRKTGPRHARTDNPAAGSQPALEPRLRRRRAGRRAPLPSACHC